MYEYRGVVKATDGVEWITDWRPAGYGNKPFAPGLDPEEIPGFLWRYNDATKEERLMVNKLRNSPMKGRTFQLQRREIPDGPVEDIDFPGDDD